MSVVDLAYRRAKAVKAVKKAADSGKVVKKAVKPKRDSQRTQSRTDEMRELFQGDMSEKKQKRTLHGVGKKKSSFKSKSRYESNYNSFHLFLLLVSLHSSVYVG